MPNGDPPAHILPNEEWEHYDLYRRVRQALLALPSHFGSETYIAGVLATDLHTLNTVLGATIEEQVVSTLNAMRSVWDPDETYALYSFIRQAQTFPDVVLRRPGNGGDGPRIILGIELKGWYLLGKETMPNFRFTVTADACNPQDLLVVVPWALAQVLSGRPVVMTPYIESARYAAEYRNYWWEHVRDTTQSREIILPENVQPYPRKADPIHDRAVADGGNNFGRLARTGVMNDYLEDMQSRTVSGIAVEHWVTFFRAFAEGQTEAAARRALARLAERIQADADDDDNNALSQIIAAVEELLDGPDPT